MTLACAALNRLSGADEKMQFGAFQRKPVSDASGLVGISKELKKQRVAHPLQITLQPVLGL